MNKNSKFDNDAFFSENFISLYNNVEKSFENLSKPPPLPKIIDFSIANKQKNPPPSTIKISEPKASMKTLLSKIKSDPDNNNHILDIKNPYTQVPVSVTVSAPVQIPVPLSAPVPVSVPVSVPVPAPVPSIVKVPEPKASVPKETFLNKIKSDSNNDHILDIKNPIYIENIANKNPTDKKIDIKTDDNIIDRMMGTDMSNKQILECKTEVKIEPKIESKIEPKIESKIESRMEPKIEQKIEPKIESKIESKIEPKIEIKSEIAPPIPAEKADMISTDDSEIFVWPILSLDLIGISFKVIGDLPPGTKLKVVNDNHLASDNSYTSFTRKYYGQSRKKIISFIDHLFYESQRNIKNIIFEIRSGINVDTNISILQGLISKINVFLHRYEIMREVYRTDSSAFAQLGIIRDKFYTHLHTFYRDLVLPKN